MLKKLAFAAVAASLTVGASAVNVQAKTLKVQASSKARRV